MMIEDFGMQVASVWEGMRKTTRSLIVGALQSQGHAHASTVYDAHSDWELSRLLTALDARAIESGASLSAEQSKQLRQMSETCAAVLQNQTRSAEVFVQLVVRAHRRRDYARIDALADALSLRFAPTEICELVRSVDAVVRALALEALALAPTSVLLGLLADPIDAEIARDALERQAAEFGSEEAREVINLLNQAEIDDEEDLL